MTRQQRRNARQASAQASRNRHQEPAPDIDWDAAIAGLKALLEKPDDARP